VPQVFVAAGSNVQPERNLALAVHELAKTFPGLRCSAAYRNVAVGFVGPDFINLVVGFHTDRPLRDVLMELQRIETLCGRPRLAPRWEPRAMDLDLLLFGDLVCAESDVVLPRPDLVRRAYMLGPMAEIAGEITHPTLGLTMRELWERFDRGAHRLSVVALPDCPPSVS
jgi:2-amino-4-hydroxy-6-hydroxymethyldihydropteridine diphosphokinase